MVLTYRTLLLMRNLVIQDKRSVAACASECFEEGIRIRVVAKPSATRLMASRRFPKFGRGPFQRLLEFRDIRSCREADNDKLLSLVRGCQLLPGWKGA